MPRLPSNFNDDDQSRKRIENNPLLAVDFPFDEVDGDETSQEPPKIPILNSAAGTIITEILLDSAFKFALVIVNQLNCMPPKQAAVFLMKRCNKTLSNRQIGRSLGIDHGTVKSYEIHAAEKIDSALGIKYFANGESITDS